MKDRLYFHFGQFVSISGGSHSFYFTEGERSELMSVYKKLTYVGMCAKAFICCSSSKISCVSFAVLSSGLCVSGGGKGGGGASRRDFLMLIQLLFLPLPSSLPPSLPSPNLSL